MIAWKPLGANMTEHLLLRDGILHATKPLATLRQSFGGRAIGEE
jgi:hypothetical protein